MSITQEDIKKSLIPQITMITVRIVITNFYDLETQNKKGKKKKKKSDYCPCHIQEALTANSHPFSLNVKHD